MGVPPPNPQTKPHLASSVGFDRTTQQQVDQHNPETDPNCKHIKVVSAMTCGATDGTGFGIDGEPYGRCNLPAGHDGDWHREIRGNALWAEWRGPRPGETCSICGQDGGCH